VKTGIRGTFVFLAALALPAPTGASEPAPIIDMHLHAIESMPKTGLCIPWVSQFPPRDPRQDWKQTFMDAMTRPNCADPIWSSGDTDTNMRETIAELERLNIVGVLSGPVELVRKWHAEAPGRFIPSVQFKIGRDDISPDEMRELFTNGGFAVLGEISNQYAGIAPDDPRMRPYWALAEELDIPVQIHMGEGTVGTAYLGIPELEAYRASLSSPLLLEDVLARHPKLRVSVMHYGSPFVDEMIAVLSAHPQVYVDLGGIQWYYPRPYFYEHLRKLVDAGFGKRIMFGSDQSDWAGVIEPSIRIIAEVPFLDAGQKRDILYNNAVRFLRLDPETGMPGVGAPEVD
jgi:predicted TIM-barrel fold metal-dependent hydrolase